MAQQTTVRFIDDLDGSDAVGTVTFSLENRAYEIDLSDENTDCSTMHWLRSSNTDARSAGAEPDAAVVGRRPSRARRRSPLVRIGRRPPRSASGLGPTVTR